MINSLNWNNKVTLCLGTDAWAVQLHRVRLEKKGPHVIQFITLNQQSTHTIPHTHSNAHTQQSVTTLLSFFAAWGCWSPLSLSSPIWNVSANDHCAPGEACPCQKSHVYYFNHAYSKGIWHGKGQSIKTQSLWKSSIRKSGNFSRWSEGRLRQETRVWLCY